MFQIAIWIGIAAVCWFIGRHLGQWMSKADTSVTELRKATQTLAIALREHGLRRLPEVLEAVTVGGIRDLIKSIHEAAVVVKSGNAAILAELDGAFSRGLDAKLQTPEGRALVAAKLAEAASVAVKVAPIVAAVV